MPNTVTHSFFCKDVLDRLDYHSKNRLKGYEIELNTFASGFDLFYFYNLTNLKPGKKIRNFGEYAHCNKTQNFFINLINYIKKNDLVEEPSIICFLYGFISHYVSDTIIHPYVYYHTGEFVKKRPSTYQYNSLHLKMELYLDAYMIYIRTAIPPHQYKHYHRHFKIKKPNDNLKDMVNYVFEETYNMPNMSAILIKCIKQGKLFNHIFRYDRLGIKKKGYQLIDYLSPKFITKKTFLSFHVDPYENDFYQNFDHDYWNNPISKEEIYNYSYIELYTIALKKAVDLIKKVNLYLYDNDDSINIKELFPNLSLKTGHDCQDKRTLKYFKY